MIAKRESSALLRATARRSVAVVLLWTGISAFAAEPGAWRVRATSGYDVAVHSYQLATEDTTETISEFNMTAELEGRSARRAIHQWRLRTELSGGTELIRELVDATYRWRPGHGDPRLRCDLTWLGRQYRGGTDYSLSSDHHDGRLELRGYPWLGSSAGLDLRLRGRIVDYRTPSILEQDQREGRASVWLNSRGDLDRSWRLGALATHRAYPDSAAIDRDVLAVEGEFDSPDIRFAHRSERRLIADETARPSAWMHWTEARVAAPAGAGHVVADMTSEIWRYDTESFTWFDSWRLDTEAGYRWGDILSAQWQGLVTVEHLAAGDSPETYTQAGIRGSIESYAHPFSGTVALEMGRRWYDSPADAEDTLDEDLLLAYTDFTYIEIWVMASWTASDHVSIDLIASYEPESHTERDDDTALGYGTLRLTWRP